MLNVKSLSLRIKDRQILQDVSFSAQSGQILGLIGPNGAGKSSLIRSLAGLEAEAHGQITCIDHPLDRIKPQSRARMLAYLPQGGEAAWPISAYQAVMLGRLPHGTNAEDAPRVKAAMEACDVWHLKDRSLTALSGGERALVLLARALAVNSPVLLLDEPCAALDPHHQLQVMEVLRQLVKQGKAVIIILHDLTLAARFCDRLVLMHQGRIVKDDAPAQVLLAPETENAFNVQIRHSQIDGQTLVWPWQLR